MVAKKLPSSIYAKALDGAQSLAILCPKAWVVERCQSGFVAVWLSGCALMTLRTHDLASFQLNRGFSILARICVPAWWGKFTTSLIVECIFLSGIQCAQYYFFLQGDSKASLWPLMQQVIFEEVATVLFTLAFCWRSSKSARDAARATIDGQLSLQAKVIAESFTSVLCDAVVPMDANLVVSESAPKLAAILLSPHSMEGRSFLDFMMPSEADRLKSYFQKLQPQLHAQSLNAQLRDAGGSLVQVQLLTKCFRNIDGQIGYVVGILEPQHVQPRETAMEDITDGRTWKVNSSYAASMLKLMRPVVHAASTEASQQAAGPNGVVCATKCKSIIGESAESSSQSNLQSTSYGAVGPQAYQRRMWERCQWIQAVLLDMSRMAEACDSIVDQVKQSSAQIAFPLGLQDVFVESAKGVGTVGSPIRSWSQVSAVVNIIEDACRAECQTPQEQLEIINDLVEGIEWLLQDQP